MKKLTTLLLMGMFILPATVATMTFAQDKAAPASTDTKTKKTKTKKAKAPKKDKKDAAAAPASK
jgi:hypothetical protein